jgi:hypothetical protein
MRRTVPCRVVPLCLVVLALMPVLALTACDPVTAGAVAAANVASVAVFQRAVPDLLVSGVTGRDCSVVRLDQGKTYCRTVQPPPAGQPYCTRSLGVVDCWINPGALPDHPPPVADGPSALTPAQEANRTRRWPGW